MALAVGATLADAVGVEGSGLTRAAASVAGGVTGGAFDASWHAARTSSVTVAVRARGVMALF